MTEAPTLLKKVVKLGGRHHVLALQQSVMKLEDLQVHLVIICAGEARAESLERQTREGHGHRGQNSVPKSER